MEGGGERGGEGGEYSAVRGSRSTNSVFGYHMMFSSSYVSSVLPCLQKKESMYLVVSGCISFHGKVWEDHLWSEGWETLWA